MKIFSKTGAYILGVVTAISLGAYAAQKISSGEIILGTGQSIQDSFIRSNQPGANDGYLKFDSASAKWVFSNDGAAEKEIGSGSGSGSGSGINLLLNSSFEEPDSPILNWSNVGGTLTQQTHTNIRTGNEKFARFVSTIAGEYFESDAITISDDIGPGCMAGFKYSQGGSAFDYKVLKSPYADPADVIASGSVIDNTSFLSAPILTFPCTGGDQLKLRVVSTAAGTIDVDEAYNGSNKGIIDLAKVSESVEYTPTLEGFGTVTFRQTPTYHLVGDQMRINGSFTAGTTTAVEAKIHLPSGYTIRTLGPIANTLVGVYMRGNTTASANGGAILGSNGHGYVGISNSGVWTNNPVDGDIRVNGNTNISSGDYISFDFTVIVDGVGVNTPQDAINLPPSNERLMSFPVTIDGSCNIVKDIYSILSSSTPSGSNCALVYNGGIFTVTPNVTIGVYDVSTAGKPGFSGESASGITVESIVGSGSTAKFDLMITKDGVDAQSAQFYQVQLPILVGGQVFVPGVNVKRTLRNSLIFGGAGAQGVCTAAPCQVRKIDGNWSLNGTISVPSGGRFIFSMAAGSFKANEYIDCKCATMSNVSEAACFFNTLSGSQNGMQAQADGSIDFDILSLDSGGVQRDSVVSLTCYSEE